MEMITIRTFDNNFFANIILTRLQNEGINCYLKDEYTIGVNPLLSNAIGGIKLAVHHSQVERAEDLLRIFHEEKVKSAVCPKCKGIAMIEIHRPVQSFMTKIFSRLSANYVVPVETVYKCTVCNTESSFLPEASGEVSADFDNL